MDGDLPINTKACGTCFFPSKTTFSTRLKTTHYVSLWSVRMCNFRSPKALDFLERNLTFHWLDEFCKRYFIQVSLDFGMRWRIRTRDLWLAAGYSWSLLWSAAAVAAVAVALAAGPTDRTTRRWLSYNLLLVPLSFQPATTLSFLCSRCPQERETLRSLQKPIPYPEYLFVTAHAWQMRLLFGWNHIQLGSGHGALRVLKSSRCEIRKNRWWSNFHQYSFISISSKLHIFDIIINTKLAKVINDASLSSGSRLLLWLFSERKVALNPF